MTTQPTTAFAKVIANNGWTHAPELIGNIVKSGRQEFKITDAAYVPQNWNGNKDVIAQAMIKGNRGSVRFAMIHRSGYISII